MLFDTSNSLLNGVESISKFLGRKFLITIILKRLCLIFLGFGQKLIFPPKGVCLFPISDFPLAFIEENYEKKNVFSIQNFNLMYLRTFLSHFNASTLLFSICFERFEFCYKRLYFWLKNFDHISKNNFEKTNSCLQHN